MSVADDIARLEARAAQLRAMFEAGEPPPADERDDASDVLTFATLAPGEALAQGAALETGDALAELVRVRKSAEAGEERLRRALADCMALDAVTGLRGPSWAASARPVASGRVSLVFTVTAPMD